jgi:lipid A 4'-phosphatase
MKGPLVYLGLAAASLALFLAAPGIDLWTSGLFYTAGEGFRLAHWAPVLVLHRAVPWIARGLVLFVVGAALWLFLCERPLWRFDRKALVFLVLAFALGPGLVVNTVLKDHWGRARPAQVEAFGGARAFTPAGPPANQCPSNCSFVSGDAALGFGFVAFAFLLPEGRRRRQAQALALGFGAIVGLARIAAGGHFLSDVVDAGLVVYGLSWLLYEAIVARDILASPRLLDFCRRAGGWAEKWRPMRPSAGLRLLFWTVATTIAVLLSMAYLDRPLAGFFHRRGPDFHRLFDLASYLGLGGPYLAVFALAFAALYWGGSLPRFAFHARAMRARAAVPGFLFAAVAVSGIAVDLLKVLFGRARPKLLFSEHLYGFTGLAFRADHWSFPSGHTVTIAALMTALWYLWPRHLLFYILVAAIVAASRIAVDQHYLSDVAAGAFIGVATVHATAWGFARAGIDLAAALRGETAWGPAPAPLFQRFTKRR